MSHYVSGRRHEQIFGRVIEVMTACRLPKDVGR